MRSLPALIFLVAAACVAAPDSQAQTTFSVIFENALLVDGTGAPPVITDVGVVGDRIGALGDLDHRPAARRIDATGLVVAPGFIDIHSHAVGGGATGSLAARPIAENLIRQGVTTVFGGQDGSSPWPIGEALAYFDANPAAVNVGLFVGHGTLRAMAVGLENQPASDPALRTMTEMVTRAMEEGAFGMSSGLEYAPGMFATRSELTHLAKATAPFGGLYISHVRDEGGGLMDSVEELIAIARGAGVAGQLTHHKIIGKHRWGGTEESLARVDAVRDEGVDVTLDVYPYTASSTGLTILFPGWSKDGGLAALQERLRDPELRARIREEVIAHINSERGGDPKTIVAASCPFDASLAGKSLARMAEDKGLQPDVPTAADQAIDLVLQGSCQGVFHSMSDDDVTRVLRSPHAMVASDGGVPEFGRGAPHPRSYGTFARVLARYVRSMDALSLEDAVYRMSGAPAARLGLTDRGVIRPGMRADLAVFDPATVQDNSTFLAPHQYASGVIHVVVNGTLVLDEGRITGTRPGRPLRRHP
ncbi:MAG: D-aminoacylase [Rhodothermales bacterium]|nr:D-aminoacylase [Rhodothermales bacterium]